MIKKLAKAFLPVFMALVALGLAGCGGGGSKTPVYEVKNAIGVIMQSKSDETGSGNPALTEKTAYFYLNWTKVSGATKYTINCVELENAEIWNTETVNPNNDGTFNWNNPEAYMDLDEELPMIHEGGKYSFKIVAWNGATIIHEFPAVTVSLGEVLKSYPEHIQYNAETQTLSWETVNEARGYRVTVYADSNYQEKRFNSGADLLKMDSYSLAGKGLSTGSYYSVIVDAVAVDQTGRTVEITRGVSGFNF